MSAARRPADDEERRRLRRGLGTSAIVSTRSASGNSSAGTPARARPSISPGNFDAGTSTGPDRRSAAISVKSQSNSSRATVPRVNRSPRDKTSSGSMINCCSPSRSKTPSTRTASACAAISGRNFHGGRSSHRTRTRSEPGRRRTHPRPVDVMSRTSVCSVACGMLNQDARVSGAGANIVHAGAAAGVAPASRSSTSRSASA